MKSDAPIKRVQSSGVVTFLDVLGWRGVYHRIPDALGKLSDLLTGLRKEGEKHRGKVQGKVQIRSISDTIAMFTDCTHEEAISAIDIHGKLASWCIRNSIESGIPVRGAISFGQFAIQENIFIGKAVDEAAAWHEHADWIGIHLTPSAEFVFDNHSQSDLWVKYSPPNKTALNWQPNCVNWTQGWSDPELEIGKIKNKFLTLGPLVPDIAVKLTNTLNFIEAVNKPKRKRWFGIFE